ncbi:MAG: T9SS type A sorting domain-containing protein [Bacteroidota bacterium]
MKKNILFALFLLAGFGLSAQNGVLNESTYNTIAEWADDVPGEATFTNTTGEERTFTWIKRDISLPDGWAAAFCDPVLCYDPSTVSQSFTLQPNESDTVFVHIYPSEFSAGEAVVEMLLYEEGLTDTVRAMFNFCIALDAVECSLTSTNELSEGQINIFPNPFTASTNIELELTKATDVQVTMYNVIGRQMYNRNYGLLNGRQQLNINGGDLPKGAYLLQLYLDEQLITRRVIKH